MRHAFIALAGVALLAAPSSAQDAAAAAPRLLAPRTAVRLLEGATATLSFVLTDPPDSIEIEILDSTDGVVARLHPGNLQPGLNRIDWDLRYEPPRLVVLRTTPPENPHIWEEPRFQGSDSRPVAHKGIEAAEFGPIAAPGRYTVRLIVDGKPYTQPLEIVLPPNSHGTEADIQSSVRLQLQVREDISAVSDMTNQIERLRKQIEDRRKQHPAADAMEQLDRKLQDVEFQLISHSDALSDEKYDSDGARLYLNFLWLNGSLGTGTGKYSGGADYAPTETAIGLVHGLETQLRAVREEYRKLMDVDVPAYNRVAQGQGMQPLIAGN
jgi:hypothetical protein